VGDDEFLRPVVADSGGAAFYSDGKRVVQDSIQISADSGLLADGVHGSFLNLHPDRIDLDLGNDNTSGLDEYVFFPAAGIKVTPVEIRFFAARGQRPGRWSVPKPSVGRRRVA
jgi:hypothetical protein